MKKIAVLGASGAIGQRTVDILRKKHYVKASYYSRVQDSKENCEYGKVDISGLNEIRGFCQGCDVIINCAGASYLNGEKIAREAAALHIPYIDPSGEAFLENKLEDIADKNVYVLSSGYFPGMSGLLMKHICKSFDIPETISGFSVSEEIPSQSAIEDFVLTNLSGFGTAFSYYDDGKIRKDDKERIEIIHNQVYRLQNYLSVEAKRIAEEYSLKRANWLNASFGDEIIKKLQEAVVAIKLENRPYKKVIEEVIELFRDKLLDTEPFTYIRVEGQGIRGEKRIIRTAKVESDCSSEISAIVAAEAAEKILNSSLKNGIYYAMDMIDSEKLIQDLPEYGVKISIENVEERMADDKYEEGSI